MTSQVVIVKDETFDDILQLVGDYGKFQQLFNWVFNFAYTLILAMTYLNHLFAVATPEHWCYVPGRPDNMSIEQWRIITIPLEKNTKGEETFSQCYMYTKPLQPDEDTNEIISCQYGWDYNRTWYAETLTSSENWVCDNDYYVINSLTLGRFGDFLGTIIFGYLGDIIGRRPIFLITVIGMVITRNLMLVTKWNYYLFMVVSFFSYFTLNAGFQSPLTIIVEISNVNRRALVVSLHYIGWTLGVCLLPLIMWIIRRADYFIIATTVPGLFVLFIFRYLIESPRWLLNQQKPHKCYKQLQVIAKVNKKEIPDNLLEKLQQISKKETMDQSSRNFLNLFSNWRLTKNTIILCICWSVTILCYQLLIYYIEILDGNPFLNFFFQAVIQFPSHIIGIILSDRFGRRFTLFFGYVGATFSILLMILLITDTKYKYVPILMAVIIKFFITISYYVINLQTLEIYPTSMRQMGSSFCLICALAVSVSVPYIATLGKTYDARYPYIIIFIGVIISAIIGTFLPETQNEKLPETIEEARIFGAEQKYINFSTIKFVKLNKVLNFRS